MDKTVVKSESPKPKLSIRIPPLPSEEEILRSLIQSPVSPRPVATLQVQPWLRGIVAWKKF
jgi:hypothetical protein